jgi:hypothetical protein
MTKKQNEELRKEWERRIDIYKASGTTQTKWCKVNDVNIHQLKYWLKRLKAPTEIKETEWVPITIEDELSHGINDSLQVKIGQAIIEVKPDFNPSLLANVVKVLQTLC